MAAEVAKQFKATGFLVSETQSLNVQVTTNEKKYSFSSMPRFFHNELVGKMPFLGDGIKPGSEMASLAIPIMPDSSPEMETPEDFTVPLMPHQKRALRRMVLIERDPKFLQEGFKGKNLGTFLDYNVKGGCLCDAVGVGKTATVLALICSEPRNPNLGPNLLVLPDHLVGQWMKQANEFCPKGIRVVLGLKNYQREVTTNPSLYDNRTLILVSVKEVLTSPKHYYNFRKLYKNGEEILINDAERREMYRSKACFISQGFMGNLYGVGGPQQQALWFPHKVLGKESGFRRVMFDEIQDLVEEGKEEKDCLLQLCKYVQNVWLITATPFPKAGASVYANHQLLGLKRLRIHCESLSPLHPTEPFEIIKRKLYIRSSMSVRKNIVENIKQKITVKRYHLSPVERCMYKLYLKMQMAEIDNISDKFTEWHKLMVPIRDLLTHLGLSEITLDSLEERVFRAGAFTIIRPTPYRLVFNIQHGLYTVAELVYRAQKKVIQTKESELEEMKSREIPCLKGTVKLAEYLCGEIDQAQREFGDIHFSRQDIQRFLAENEIKSIRVSQQDKKGVMKETFLFGTSKISQYVNTKLKRVEEVKRYFIDPSRPLLQRRQAKARLYENLLKDLHKQNDELKQILTSPDAKSETPKYGSKLKAFVDFLKERLKESPEEKFIVFATSDDCLKIVGEVINHDLKGVEYKTLRGNSDRKAEILSTFVNCNTQVLLVSSNSSASGANLQVASNVIFLDIPGESPKQAATLVHQAIGRVIRLGQNSQVKITYFVGKETIEEDLQLSLTTSLKHLEDKNQENASYVCEELSASIPELQMPEAIKRAKEEGIEIIQQKSLEERLDCAIKKAELDGEIISLTGNEEDSVVIIEDMQSIEKTHKRKATENTDVKIKAEKLVLTALEEPKVKVEKGMGNLAKRMRIDGIEAK